MQVGVDDVSGWWVDGCIGVGADVWAWVVDGWLHVSG